MYHVYRSIWTPFVGELLIVLERQETETIHMRSRFTQDCLPLSKEICRTADDVPWYMEYSPTLALSFAVYFW